MDPVHTAQTIRMPASAEVCVDSMDRYTFGNIQVIAPTTSSNWRTNLPQYVLNGYFTRLAVTQILFNWNLPTIIEGYNDTLLIYDDATTTTYQVVLDPGFYTPDELATEIQAQLNATIPGADFTVLFNGNHFTLVNAAGDWAFEDFALSDQQEILKYQRTLITCGLLYGQSASPIQQGQTLISAVPTMLATRFIDIYSSYITKFQDVKDTTTAQGTSSYNCVIARIYPTGLNNTKQISPEGTSGVVDAPTVITMEYNTPKYIMWNPREALSNFDIQLRDEFGSLVPWTPNDGCEYTLTMFASES